MTRTIPLMALLAALLAAPAAEAACRVEYKAKKDNPLRLTVGTADLPDDACASKEAAKRALAPQLKEQGWTLLAIVSILGNG